MSKNLVIILDACRYDALKQELPKYTNNFLLFPMYSSSHNTPTFYKNITGVEDFVLLTANPTVAYIGEMHKWKRVIHTKSIDPFDNIRDCVELLKNEDKVYLHLIPPHAPWLGKEGKEKYKNLMKELKFSVNLNPERRHFGPVGIESKIYSSIGAEEGRKYYLENLNYALEAIFTYYEKLPKPFVVTADHGELLGEEGLFGHPWECRNNYILRTIPLAVIY